MSKENFTNSVTNLEKEFDKTLVNIDTQRKVESLRIAYLGRNGKIADLFQKLASIPIEDRRKVGKSINCLKGHIQTTIEDLKNTISSRAEDKKCVDHSLPGNKPYVGRYHPVNLVLRRIKSCFQRIGFSVAQGPEVETDYYNFEALNFPKGHPARDMHDTLYITDDTVLRTHTSPVQIRIMESQQPPVRIIAPGRCYRRDTPDSTHSPVFHQVEGLCVDQGVTFADLKGTLLAFARELLGSDTNIRFRPSFFPFTEPSAEYDFSCIICRGKGCKVCKGSGWIEISGAGMVNPAVFKYVDYDSEQYTGFAFGMGVERIAMILYEVQDIRLFYENDIRFLNQF